MNKNVKLKPAAILFDMDGVLVDSLDSWWKSLNAALKNNNNKEISREEFIENFWGHELLGNLRKLGLDEKIIVFCNNIYYNYIDEFRFRQKPLECDHQVVLLEVDLISHRSTNDLSIKEGNYFVDVRNFVS